MKTAQMTGTGYSAVVCDRSLKDVTIATTLNCKTSLYFSCFFLLVTMATAMCQIRPFTSSDLSFVIRTSLG